MAPQTDARLMARSTPVQRRAHERVDTLLDAAAAIIEESGSAALTTSAVAERSGSSVGVVYRYYPHIDAIFVALGERNRERYAARLDARLASEEAPTWRDFVAAMNDTYAQISREEPAFVAIRFGDAFRGRYKHANGDAPREVGRELLEALVSRYDFEETPELAFAAELAMECAIAVMRRAFIDDRNGDQRFVEKADRIVIAILLPHSPGGVPVVIPD